MSKPVMVDGKLHRWRRGKLIEIPPEWVGHITTRRTINARPSKLPRKLRKLAKNHGYINRRRILVEKANEKDPV